MPTGSVWRIPAEVRKANAKRTASDQHGRYLVVNRVCRSVIDGQRGNGSAWVFPAPRRKDLAVDRPIKRLNNTAWRSAWRRAGLPEVGTKRGVHNLRHTFGERAEAAGLPWEYRKALLGHAVHDVTALYSGPGLSRLLEWAEMVARETALQLRPVAQTSHSGKEGGGFRAAK